MSPDLLATFATWVLVASPLLLMLAVLALFVWRPRRRERLRREAQLMSVFNSKARRERGE